MTQTVTLEDGSVHLFPDDATPQEMEAAIGSGASLDYGPGSTGGASGSWAGPSGGDLFKHGLNSAAVGVTQHALAVPGVGPALLAGGNAIRSALGKASTTAPAYNAQMAQNEANFQQNRGPDAGKFSWADLGGKMAAMAPLAAVAAPETLGGMALAGAATGAGGALANPVYPQAGQGPVTDQQLWNQTGKDALFGGVTGGVAGPAAGAAGRMISPQVSQGMQYLISKGIVPPPGESLGGLGQVAEHIGEKIPFVQNRVMAAKQRAFEQYNRAAANEALTPIQGEMQGLGLVQPGSGGVPQLSTAATGGPMISQMNSNISKVYDSVLGQTRFAPGADPQFGADITNLRDLAQNLNSAQKAKFNNYMDQYLYSKLPQPAPAGNVVAVGDQGIATPQPSIDGITMKNIMGDFYNLARRTDSSATAPPEDSQLASALRSVPLAMKQSLMRQNPAMATSLNNVDRAYALGTQINNAAARASGNYIETPAAGLFGDAADQAEAQAAEGLTQGKSFTPQDHLKAIYRNDTSANHNRFATGQALGQQLPMVMQQEIGPMPSEAGGLSKIGTLALATELGSKMVEGGDVSRHLPFLLGAGMLGTGISGLYSKGGQQLAHLAGNVRPPGFDTLGAVARQAALPASTAYSQESASTPSDFMRRLQSIYPGSLSPAQ